MPLIQVKSSTSQPQADTVKSLLSKLSESLAQHLGKPEAYIMTAFEADVMMSFAGTFDPVCYLEIKSVGNMSSEQTKKMSHDFCTIISERLDVPAKRIYIEFADAQGYMWGWNEATFG